MNKSNTSPATLLALRSMAICNSRNRYLQVSKPLLHPTHFSTFFFLVSLANAISFNFSSFDQNTRGIFYLGDAFSSSGVIQLTKNQRDQSIVNSVGQALYTEELLLWDTSTRKLADFTSHFSFIIKALNGESGGGDGLAFFLSPYHSLVPTNSQGGSLGLFSNTSAFNKSENQIVAVEFDSHKNDWDPSSDHVGININSINSVTNLTWTGSIKQGVTANAWVSYNASTKTLSVFLTYAESPVFDGTSTLSYVVDLTEILPERVTVGFSASTGRSFEIHNILSWSFNSTLDLEIEKKNRIGLLVVSIIGVGVLIGGPGLVWFFWWRASRRRQDESMDLDVSFDDEFEKGRGPKRFHFKELAGASKNFVADGKLGEGGFGEVFKGLLRGSNLEVAIKRVSRGSKQGKKEYMSEVKIISRLRHRNLVQLVGWCHDHGELLLVYEFMPNGSLDSHLFSEKRLLPWPTRYKIALGLASALLYLHEEWEQCVVHRDIKSSNVMLDSYFNAKLGDFGLARLIDHDRGSQTTVLAGTMGYLAPECLTTGKASKESDVYSFGVVALEITCGRRPVQTKEKLGKVKLVNWVWELYGRNAILEAADGRLSSEFDAKQMERLMVVGLWCAHPDYSSRPSIRHAINVLNFEVPLPDLPSKMPVPIYSVASTATADSVFCSYPTNS